MKRQKQIETVRMDIFPEFEVNKHETIDSILQELFKFGDPTLQESALDIAFCTRDSGGIESTIGIDEIKKGIKTNGLFGFVDSESIINVWIDMDKVSFEYLLFFLGHEIGHKIEEPELPHEHPLDEEKRADGYAFAAKEAYRLAIELMDVR